MERKPMNRNPIVEVSPQYASPPTRKECGEAMCWECMGHWGDGKVDCENKRCPFYQYQPYRKLEPDYWWRAFNPKHKGMVTWEDSKREFSREHLEKLRIQGKKLGKTRGK